MPIEFKPIKWRDIDAKRVGKLVSRFNAKLTRTARKNPQAAPFLPDRLNADIERSRLKTGSRADFNRRMATLERFLKPGAEAPIVTPGGVKTTDWQLKETRYAVRRINNARRKSLEKLAPSPQKGNLGLVRDMNLRPKRTDVQNINARNWDKFVESVEKQANDSYQNRRLMTYVNNYLGLLENNFPELSALATRLRNIDPNLIYQAAGENPFLEIGFFYDEMERLSKMTALRDNWEDFLNSHGL